ncbi:EpsG family protein [Enterococcus devriesei]|uniref:EpsG family protein n=1 Tax=Enterococcus devriesei TaxID=319970 RepID=UPI0028AF9E04|nr:EpsG family protein [Enterococcus devriesei]
MELGIFQKRIKNNKIYSMIVPFIMMWLIWAGNTSNADYRLYQNIFNYMRSTGDKSYGGVEIGFGRLMWFCGEIGLDYQGFIFLVSFLCLLLYTWAFFRLTKFPNIIFLLYFFFPFFLDVMQLRNALASAIVANAIPFLIDKKNFKFIALVIFSSFFHTTMLFYLCLLLVNLSLKNLRSITICGTLCLIFSVKKILPLLLNFLPSGHKYVVYLQGNTLRTQILYILYFMIYIFIVEFIVREFKQMKTIGILRIDYNTENRTILFAQKSSYVLLLLLPLLLIDSDFFRLFRNVFFIFNICLMTILKNGVYIKNVKYFLVNFFAVLFVLLTGINYLYAYQFKNLVLEIFRSNIFLN